MNKEEVTKIINKLLRYELTKAEAIDLLAKNQALEPKVKKPKEDYSEDVYNAYPHFVALFEEHLQPKTEQVKQNWLKVLHQLTTIEELDLQTVYRVARWARSSDFWAKNFLSLVKLRQKNKDGIKYIVVFNEAKKDEERNNKGATPSASDLQAISNARYAKD